MALSVSTIGDNPFIPGVTAETYIPDQLIAGNMKLVTQPIVLGSGGPYARGTVLMQSTNYSVTTAAGTNTGNGTIGSVSAVAGALVGTYKATATSASNWTVTDPEGNSLAAATTGSAYSHGGIAFTITAGGTAFAAGDTFTLTVVDSIGNFVLATASGVSGGGAPVVLVDVADATSAPVRTGAYMMGEFNVDYLIYDTSFTPETLTTALRPFGLIVKTVVSAQDPGTSVTNFA